MGFQIIKNGIKPSLINLRLSEGTPSPKDKTYIQVFLGLLNFYCTFKKNRSYVFKSLQRLLEKAQFDVGRLYTRKLTSRLRNY